VLGGLSCVLTVMKRLCCMMSPTNLGVGDSRTPDERVEVVSGNESASCQCVSGWRQSGTSQGDEKSCSSVYRGDSGSVSGLSQRDAHGVAV